MPNNFKKQALNKLRGYGSSLLEVLDRPGRATRAGISALQQDEDVLSAIKDQITGEATEAPSGADIATKISEDYDIENPAVLGTIATAADVLDPSSFVPGGQATKLAPLLAKFGKAAPMMMGAMGKIDDVSKATKNLGRAETVKDAINMARAKSGVKVLDNTPKYSYKNPGTVKVLDDTKNAGYGSVKVLDDQPKMAGQAASKELRESVSLPEQKQRKSLKEIFGEDEAQSVVDQFPQVGQSVEDKKMVLKRLMEE